MKDYRITVRFPAELRQRLKAAAHRSGTRESDLVRAAVERQLAAEDAALTAYELAKKAGANEYRIFQKQWPVISSESQTLVTVEFFARGDGTEVVLTHTLFGSAAVRDSTDQGWNGCFDMLEKALQSSAA